MNQNFIKYFLLPKKYLYACVIFISVLYLIPAIAIQVAPLPQAEEHILTGSKVKDSKSWFQQLKDHLSTATLSVNILGRIVNIGTGTSCDPKSVNKLFKKALTNKEDLNQASCSCCLAKEMTRSESYDNSISKCRVVSKYCGTKLPYKNESQFFQDTQILALNQKSERINKIKVSEPSIAEEGIGVQDIEYMRYIWNLPHFYVFDQFTLSNYKLKFQVGQGYLAPNPMNMRTSTNPYNHHFNKDKGIFFNPWPNAAPPIAAINAVSGILGSLDVKKIQRPWLPQKSYKIKPHASVNQGIRATMIGHATILLQFSGINIITDPIFYDIGMGKKEDKTVAFYKRIKVPGVPFEWLPKIHFVVISHNHMDHFDVASLKKIEELNPDVKYITPLGYTKLLRDIGINKQNPNRIFELDWWDSIDFPDVRFTSLPTQHWCGRSLDDVNKMLWTAYAIKTQPEKVYSKTIYFAGDTGFGPHFEEIAKKFPYFDLSLIPIGAYCPMHKEGGGHINPYEAVKVHKILKSKRSMGIHFDTYQLAQEPYGEARKTLQASLRYYQINPDEFVAADSAEYIDIDDRGKFTFHQISKEP